MLQDIQFKYFKFSDIFSFKRGKRLTKENQVNGDIAYISSSKFNHGIDNYIDPPEGHEIYKNKLTLSNSGSVGYVFYHNYDFVASDHITVIDIKDEKIQLNESIALFLKPIIEAIKYKYNFAREISNDRLKKETIKLPVDKNGNPNWIFMEDYINNLDGEFKSNPYFKITHKNKINTNNWEFFKLGGSDGIFDIDKGNAIINNLNYGDYPLISSSQFDNGFNSFKDNGDYTIFEGNVITVASNGSVGKAFYQEKDFIATGDINVLKLKNYQLNKYIAIFLCTIIEKERFRYNYGRKWGLNQMKKSKIKLPSNNGIPNWEYMETYIKSLKYSKNL